MGLIYTDLELVRGGYLDAGKVRSLTVRALVDSGAYQLCINDNIRRQLDLTEVDRITAELADGTLTELAVVGPVEIRFKTRRTVCNAAVLPGNTEVLLGSIPMEDMDMDVNPATPYISKKKVK